MYAHVCFAHLYCMLQDGSVGVYGEDDRRFVFHSVIVGQVARAQYKISNPNKVRLDW